MTRVYELLKKSDGTEPAEAPERAEVDRSLAGATIADEKNDPADEEIARLVQTMFFATHARAPRRLLFCGVDEVNGSSVVCATAGRALAARSESVCLLDANAQSPRLSKVFGLNPEGMRDDVSGRDRCIQVAPRLWLAGPHMITNEDGILLPLMELKILLGKLQGVYGTVLIDAPSTSSSRDAALLGQLADAAILVVEANSTRKLAARKAKEFLEGAGVQLIGTILNNRSFPIPEKIYRRL